jgi:DNA polymerase III epsilon subunit-like protein
MKPERYFSVDIESSGPIPGRYSMLSLGACAVDAPDESYYVEFKPISLDFVPDALRVSGFELDRLATEGRAPAEAMLEFQRWIDNASAGMKPVFVGFNASYDWQFVNWYFDMFCGRNPFGFGAVDIKSYYMGLTGKHWSASTSSQLPAEFQSETPQSHNALDDAKAQASMFVKMVEAAGKKAR